MRWFVCRVGFFVLIIMLLKNVLIGVCSVVSVDSVFVYVCVLSCDCMCGVMVVSCLCSVFLVVLMSSVGCIVLFVLFFDFFRMFEICLFVAVSVLVFVRCVNLCIVLRCVMRLLMCVGFRFSIVLILLVE